MARQERYQTLDRVDDYIGTGTSFLNKITLNIFPRRGTWSGGAAAWGEQRVWLEPSFNTNTYGRDNFSIHGGVTPGSAGCIDLTWQMPDFAKWYRNNGKDMIIHVKY